MLINKLRCYSGRFPVVNAVKVRLLTFFCQAEPGNKKLFQFLGGDLFNQV
jgi:hypothetical protein